jgi:hypothetical protein
MSDMMNNDNIRIQYAAKYAQSSNYWKYSIGQNECIKRLHVIERKKVIENNFKQWLETDTTLKLKYERALPALKSIVENRQPSNFATQYYVEGLFRNVELLWLIWQMVSLYEELNKSIPNKILVQKYSNSIRDFAYGFYPNFNKSTDLKVAAATFSLLSNDLIPEFKFNYLLKAEKKAKKDFYKFTSKLYAQTFLTDSLKLEALLDKPDLSLMQNDKLFMFGYDAINKYRQIYKQLNIQKTNFQKYKRKLISGIREMNQNKVFSPDANFSMRVSYGIIQNYKPADAIQYSYYSTLKGIMEKEDSLSFSYVVPSKLKQLYQTSDYGIYSTSGEMPVCFTSNNDIAGGNSGSPVLNGKGQLIGIAFDGNWEGLSADFIYEPQLKRAISVDIRYVLFIIDKFAGAGYLLNEMQIEK